MMRPLVLAFVLLFAFTVPMQAIDAPGTDTVLPGSTSCALEGPTGLAAFEAPDAGLDARLQALYDLYEGLPGFVDVHYAPADGDIFFALFIDEIPPAARLVSPPVPVLLETIPGLEPAPATATDTDGLDVADVLCQGIRPGARITAGTSACTLGFIYTDGSRIYASTAGHCISVGQTARIAGIGAIGTAIYSTGSGGGGNDFALIEVPTSLHGRVDPTMCQYGGPLRENNSGIFGQVILHSGHGGGVIEAPARPKVGAGLSWGVRSFSWFGAGVPGDSGSAVQTGSGAALGVTTHISIGIGGTNLGMRGDVGLSQAGYGHLDLMTCPMNLPN